MRRLGPRGPRKAPALGVGTGSAALRSPRLQQRARGEVLSGTEYDLESHPFNPMRLRWAEWGEGWSLAGLNGQILLLGSEACSQPRWALSS